MKEFEVEHELIQMFKKYKHVLLKIDENIFKYENRINPYDVIFILAKYFEKHSVNTVKTYDSSDNITIQSLTKYILSCVDENV